MIKSKEPPSKPSGMDLLLDIAVAAALKGIAGPFGNVAKRVALRGLGKAHPDVADSFARAVRTASHSLIKLALGSAEKKEPDSKAWRTFITRQQAVLVAAHGDAKDNFVRTVRPALQSADLDYLEALHAALKKTSGSVELIHAQTTSTLIAWTNFIARLRHGTSGLEKNLQDRPGHPKLGWGRWYQHGVMKIDVKVPKYGPVKVRAMRLVGVGNDVVEHLRDHGPVLGELPIHKFIRFSSEYYGHERAKLPWWKGSPAEHEERRHNDFTGEFVQRIDGSINLANTDTPVQRWLARYGAPDQCRPNQRTSASEEGGARSILRQIHHEGLRKDKAKKTELKA